MPPGISLREQARRRRQSARQAVQRADQDVLQFQQREPIERRREFAGQLEEQTGTDVDPREDIDARGDEFMPRNNFFLDVAVQKLQPETQGEIGRQDVQRQEQGFGLTQRAQEREAVFGLQPETEQDIGRGDVERTEQGFGLTMQAQQREAVQDLQGQTEQQLDTGDIRQTDSGFGLTQNAQRREAFFDLQGQTDTTIDQSDVTRQDGAFGLSREAQREEAASGFDMFGPSDFVFTNGELELDR